jgi:hypothetical protein
MDTILTPHVTPGPKSKSYFTTCHEKGVYHISSFQMALRGNETTLTKYSKNIQKLHHIQNVVEVRLPCECNLRFLNSDSMQD